MPSSVSARISEAFRALPDHDPSAVPAYNAMREEVHRQFDHLTGSPRHGGLGIDVRSVPNDPYGREDWTQTFGEMRHDVMHNNRLDVLSTKVTRVHDAGVPFLSDEDNDKFRAVHDSFGHLASGRGVDFHGEEAAWQHHNTMFSPLARQAVATDLRGFTSQMRSMGLGNFPNNKSSVLPAHLRDPRLARTGSEHERNVARQQAVVSNKKQGIV